MDHKTMPLKDLDKHITRVEKEQSGDIPVSTSDRKYLNTIKAIRAKRMKMKEEVRLDELTGDFLAHASDEAAKKGKIKQSSDLGAGAFKRGISSDYMKNKSRFAKKQSEIDSAKITNIGEALKASDPVGKWIHDFVHSDNSKFADKTKEERRKMALGAYYAAQKESYENSTEELAEGRGRPPKEGSKAWQAAQAKASSGEGSDQEADKNIVNQMRKKPVGDTHHLVFGNGDKKDVNVKHVNKALSMLANTPKPVDREKLQASLAHSHKRFMDTVTSGKAVVDAPRERVTLAKRVEEAVNPSTTRADRGDITVTKKRKPDGSYVLVKTNKQGTKKTGDIIDAQESYDYSDEDTNSLNNLYLSLSEQNQELFEKRMMTDEGIQDLINFARTQGF